MENEFQNVTEAIKIIRNELLKHEELYQGFVSVFPAH